MYSSSTKTAILAAIAGANTTPIAPKNLAVTNSAKKIIKGCKSINFPKTYGLTKLFSIHCAKRKKNITNPKINGP